MGHAEAGTGAPDPQAAGKVSEALETIERARGHLYSFHRLTGRAEPMVRERLTGGRRHVHEAECKERRRTHGHPAHTASPNDSKE